MKKRTRELSIIGIFARLFYGLGMMMIITSVSVHGFVVTIDTYAGIVLFTLGAIFWGGLGDKR